MEKDCLDLFVCLEFTGPSGAPNDGFLQNTMKKRFYAIQSTFRSVEMHFKGLFEITRASVLFSRKFLVQFKVLRKRECFLFLSPSHFIIRIF